jgi:hypothetical protein
MGSLNLIPIVSNRVVGEGLEKGIRGEAAGIRDQEEQQGDPERLGRGPCLQGEEDSIVSDT